MDIRYKQYPHPVLMTDTDDYNTTFDFSASPTKGIREIIIKGEVNLQDDEMQQLINNNMAEYVVHIECSLTSYREVCCFSENTFERHIPEKELNGRVSVCCFIVAKQNLTDYSNSHFNEDYLGISFDIERGSIMAIGGQVNFDVTKETEDLGKIPSIVSICRHAADEDDCMKIDIDNDKIVIILSNSGFQNYKILSAMPKMVPVFHSMIILPALIYVFETLRRDGLDGYQDRRWYLAIQRALQKSSIELNSDTLSTIPSYELAQKLLDLPVDRALQAISTIGDIDEEE